MSSNSVFRELGNKFLTRNVDQIKLKYESLRRGFSIEKMELNKSGAGGVRPTLYDDEMLELWGRRKKFTVTIDYGVDSARMHIEENERAKSNNVQGQSVDSVDVEATVSSDVKSSKKRKRQPEIGTWLSEIKAQDDASFEKFKKLELELVDRADARMKLFVDELKTLGQSSSFQPSFTQRYPTSVSPPTPSTSCSNNDSSNFSLFPSEIYHPHTQQIHPTQNMYNIVDCQTNTSFRQPETTPTYSKDTIPPDLMNPPTDKNISYYMTFDDLIEETLYSSDED